MAKHRVKGKKLVKHDMQAIFEELYQIDEMIKNGTYMGKQTYITTRLVTIIEQFFREVMEFLLRKYPKKRPKTIELDTRILNNIVKAPGWEKIFMTERIISQSFSFQNTNAIDEAMREHGKIYVFQDLSKPISNTNDSELLKYEYDKFFDARHSVVHSIELRPYLNVRKYYDMTEKLLDYMLVKVEYASFYESGNNAALLFQNNKSDTYQKMFKKLQNEIKNEQKSAINAMSCKNYMEAISHYNRILELNPSDVVANMEKGLAFYQLEKYTQSIESFEQHLELYDDSVLYVILGLSLQKLGEHEDAMIYFKKALEHESDKTSIYNKLAVSTGSTGWPDEALKYTEMALDKNPNDKTALGLKKLTEEYLEHLNKKFEYHP